MRSTVQQEFQLLAFIVIKCDKIFFLRYRWSSS